MALQQKEYGQTDTSDMLTTSREFAKSSRCTINVTVAGPFDDERSVLNAATVLHKIHGGVGNESCRSLPS